jgi:hypothetical protein
MSLIFSAKQAAELTKLVKYSGLNNTEALKLAGTFGKNIESSEKLQNSVLKTATNTSYQYGVSVNLKSIMKDISNTSDGIVVKFKGSAEALTAATVEARKYGLTLEQIDKTGESLLNWESSIETELKAELLTGREINVERARAAALMGDQVSLMREINTQVGTLEDFQNMNVLAQRSLAEAFGMSRDEMSKMLMDQQRMNLLGDIAKKSALEQLDYAKANNIELGESLTMQLQQQSVQERLVRVLENINDKLMGAGLEKVGTAAAEVGFNLQTARRRTAAAAANAMFGADDLYSDYGNRTLVTPDGTYALNNGDTVIAGTKLFKGDDVFSGPKDSLTLTNSNKELLVKMDQLINITAAHKEVSQQGRVQVWNDQVIARENLRSNLMNNPIYFS